MGLTIKEKDIESLILDWLSLKGIFGWKNQSVGVFDPVTKGFRRLNPRQIKGVSDISAIYGGQHIAIEVKSKTGKLSEYQESFLKRVEDAGGITCVARSLDDVIKLFENLKARP